MGDKSPIDEAAIPSADDAGNQAGRESPVARSKRKNIMRAPVLTMVQNPGPFSAGPQINPVVTRMEPGSKQEQDALDAMDFSPQDDASPFGPAVRARDGSFLKAMETVIPQQKRKQVRVTFEVAGGAYSMPARGLVCTPGGIMIFFNHDDSAVTFSPAVGAEVVVSSGDMRMACYSVGLFFDVPELGVSVLAMVARKE